MLEILAGLPLVLFWAAVLSYIPVTLFLLLINPRLHRMDLIQSQGIYILDQEEKAEKDKRLRVKVLVSVYTVCATILLAVYLFNFKRNVPGLGPFDILSSLSVMLFGVSVITYLPVAVYIFIKKPFSRWEEGVCLEKIFIAYGVALLVFSIIFAFRWVESRQIDISIESILLSLGVIFLASISIAYLPVLAYIAIRKSNPFHQKRVHPNVIFVIYSLSFLTFSIIYIYCWGMQNTVKAVFSS